VAPPADGRGIAIAIDPASERLQALHPWPAWTGGDPQGLRVLAKTRGKTTTDHIAPAGPWLRYRGHLEKFSANLLAGAVDAFAGGVGRARDPVSGTVRTFAETARSWRDSGIAWVIVGDTNYGEGSSREHAALTPRLLGGIAVIARSFARIHETNLKKQGLLALTFRDPLDWERIGADDRIALVGVDRLAAGQPVKAIVTHPDGTAEIIVLDHSYSDRQVAWFRAGSALAATAAAPAAMAS
ncbi:MAG: aconitate hydratase, partial [Alphaproteobacteria bacterium]